MMELFEICPKMQVFLTFFLLFEIWGGGRGVLWSKWCKVIFFDVTGTN